MILGLILEVKSPVLFDRSIFQYCSFTIWNFLFQQPLFCDTVVVSSGNIF